MAHDEDILREATALVNRAQIELPWCEEPVYIGFRRTGALSIFLGSDEVYQFDPESHWRRGYFHGRLLKAERGQLVELERVRTPTAHLLRQNHLSDALQQLHLDRLESRMSELQRTLDGSDWRLVGSVTESDEIDVCERLRQWLNQRPRPIPIAKRLVHPHKKRS